MQKLSMIVLVLVVCTGMLLPTGNTSKTKSGKAGKTVQIGSNTWYTEQNTFQQMKKIARKAQKPVFTVFSATWCGPCQRLKKNVFKKPEFKQVADEVILLYIEQTEPEGDKYCEANDVRAFPTIKLFSPGGYLLSQYKIRQERTVESFQKWVKAEKANYQKLIADPFSCKNPVLTLNHLNATTTPGKAVAFFEKYMKKNGDQVDPAKDLPLIKEAVDCYIAAGSIQKAIYWGKKARSASLNSTKKVKRDKLPDEIFDMHRAIIDHMIDKGKTKQAEAVSEAFLDQLVGKDVYVTSANINFFVKYSKKHGFHIDKSLAAVDKIIKKATEESIAGPRMMETCNKAGLLCKKGKQKEAYDLLVGLSNEKIYNNIFALVQIVTEMVELKIADQKTLEIAERAVKQIRSGFSLNALARAKAALGDYKEAIKIGEESLKNFPNDYGSTEFKEDLAEWRTKVK